MLKSLLSLFAWRTVRDTWVDLFCGSAIVTLLKPRHKRETINDLNGDIVNLPVPEGCEEISEAKFNLLLAEREIAA